MVYFAVFIKTLCSCLHVITNNSKDQVAKNAYIAILKFMPLMCTLKGNHFNQCMSQMAKSSYRQTQKCQMNAIIVKIILDNITASFWSAVFFDASKCINENHTNTARYQIALKHAVFKTISKTPSQVISRAIFVPLDIPQWWICEEKICELGHFSLILIMT